MKNLTFPEKQTGNQTPMLREGTRTPIYNKINMSQDYQSWLKYQKNVSQSQQTVNKNQKNNIDQQYFVNQINFKRKIENAEERMIFCVDRNAVNVIPLKYTIDNPMNDIFQEDDNFTDIFQDYQNNQQTQQTYQSEKTKVITELQPDEEDQPFEDYEDFLMEENQNQKILNVHQSQHHDSVHQTQVTQKNIINQNFQEYQPVVIDKKDDIQPKKENVIVLLPKSSREDVISNKIQSDSIKQNEVDYQELENLPTKLNISNKFSHQEQTDLLLSSQDQRQENFPQVQHHQTLNYNSANNNLQTQYDQNYDNNYQQKLLQSDEQYDPVQSILNKYQYKEEISGQNYVHKVEEQRTVYTQRQTTQNTYNNYSHPQSTQETTTKKFVVVNGQRIPYDEYYKNKNQNVINTNQQYDAQANRSYYRDQEQQQSSNNNYQQGQNNIQQEVRTKKVNFQVPEQNESSQQRTNDFYKNEDEKMKRLQYIKEQLKMKEQEQMELNKRINYIKGELDHEKMLKKSIDEQEKSLVDELNTKSQQIDMLKHQNEQLRHKISQHYTEIPQENQNEQNDLIDSKKLNTIKEESHDDNNSQHFNKFETFGQADSMSKFYPVNSNSKKRDVSPGTNLRRKNELIPSQTVPKDYRPPTYDSVDQQQFSRLYNQTNYDQKFQFNL